MAEEHQKFLDFDWADDRWQTYLNGLYPPPNQKQIPKFKKKWYKKHIDPDFDESYEPPSSFASGSAASASSSSAGVTPASDPNSPFNSVVHGDGEKWAKMGPKATICFLAYVVALTISVAAVAGVFPAYQALVVLVAAFILEILAKYGLKISAAYVQVVLLDDVGSMPMMALTLLTPGLHPVLRLLALVPPFLAATLSFATICKVHPRLPGAIRDFFSPLAESSARYQILEVRANIEVGLGLILIVAVFTVRAAPITALLFWNFMMMRYMMSPWTQATFRKLDGFLNPVLVRVPLVNTGYTALKRFLFSFVDPSTRKSGSLCSIL